METLELNYVEDVICREMAKILNIKPKDIDKNKAFDKYGLDSHDIVTFAGELSDKLKIEIDPVIFYEFNNITEVNQYLTKQIEKGK
jgi:acyl carrier protein